MRKLASIGILLLSTAVWAQIEHPKASPFARVEQQIGLSKVTVEYSRPAVNGRKIFGDLVPYGRIWRVGANESTKFTVDFEISVMGNSLPKGTYALYAFPEKEEWEVVFHNNTSHWGDGRTAYDAEEDAFRIRVKPEDISGWQENFLIAFDRVNHNAMEMYWVWEKTKIVIPITVDTDSRMRSEIELKIKENPSAQTFYEAARYLQEQDKDHAIALLYLDRAIELGGDTYYFHRVRSLVLAALKDYEGAITSAEKSLELADELGKDEFVRINEKNIHLWKQKLKTKQ